ncbi:MAG TPA: hypothetical protein VEU08_11085 [Vicinamibacterales bacterium]|nr:hypothetical protein [Vicinamibacterales bacterium]
MSILERLRETARQYPMLTRGWWISTAACALSAGALLVATAVETPRVIRFVPPQPPEIAHDLVVRNAPDQSGRKATFRLLLFTDEFRWRLSSAASLENGLAEPEFTDAMKAVLNSAREIICVGASSQELPPGVPFEQGKTVEERRAARRAEQIAVWVRKALTRPLPVRKLNVGYHTPTERSNNTSDQRRVVIILVLERDDQTNIDQALREAMERESARAPILDALLKEYSLGGGANFTWE